MLFDKNLTVPDIASAVQLEERPRPKVANPYNTLALRKQAKEKKVDKKSEQVWEPHVQVGKKVASNPVSHFCFEPDPLFTDHNVVINLQKVGPVEPPSPPPVPSASPLPQLDSAAIPAAPSRRRKVSSIPILAVSSITSKDACIPNLPYRRHPRNRHLQRRRRRKFAISGAPHRSPLRAQRRRFKNLE
jgi:hypothetical protein